MLDSNHFTLELEKRQITDERVKLSGSDFKIIIVCQDQNLYFKPDLKLNIKNGFIKRFILNNRRNVAGMSQMEVIIVGSVALLIKPLN